MAEKLGEAVLELRTDDSAFDAGMDRAEKKASGFAGKLKGFGDSAVSVGGKMSLALTAPLMAIGASAFQAAAESKAAFAQVEAALASMGGQSGKTAEDLQKSAAELMRFSTFDDDDILSKVTANMLTFGNVSGEAFDRAQQAAVDLSTRMGTDLQGSALMVGKALNDPTKGLAALSRAGIQFSADQKATIKSMQASGDMAGAQAIMLGELEKQFGGAAKAARDASPTADMTERWNTMQEVIGGSLLTAFESLSGVLVPIMDGFNNLSPGIQTGVVTFAALVAVAGPVLMMVGMMASGIAGLATAGTVLGPAFTAVSAGIGMVGKSLLGLLANPIVLAAAAIIGGIYLAWKHWDKIKPIIDAVGKAISDWWTGNVEPVLDWVMDKVRAVADFFGDYFGAQLANAIGFIKALLSGDFKGAWEFAKAYLQTAVKAMLGMVQAIAPGVANAMKNMYLGVKTWTQDKLSAVFDWLQAKLEAVGQWFFNLYDAVVGNSYYPDMIDGIAKQTKRLGPEMVKVTKDAIDKVDAMFAKLSPEYAVTMKAQIDKNQTGYANTPKPKSDGKKKSKAEQERAEAAQKWSDDWARADAEVADAQAALAVNYWHKYAFERAELERGRKEAAARIVAEKDYTAAQKWVLLFKLNMKDSLERELINRREAEDMAREELELATASRQNEADILRAQTQFATTRQERYAIEKRLMELAHRQERADLEAIIASEMASDTQKQIARDRLAILEQLQASDRAGLDQDFAGPLDKYRQEIATAGNTINDDMEDIAVNGLKSLNDGLVDAIMGAKSLGDVFSSMADMIIKDLLRIAIQQAIIKPLADALFGGTGDGSGETSGGGIGGIFGSIGKIFAGFFATGGLIPAGQFGIVGEKGPEPIIGTSRGAMVLPNSSLRGGFGQSQDGGAPSIHIPISIDATGADAAGLARVQNELAKLRKELPATIVGTIQNAGSRGALGTGGWR